MLEFLRSLFVKPEFEKFILARIDLPPLEFEGKEIEWSHGYALYLTRKGNYVVRYNEKNESSSFWCDKVEDIWDIAKKKNLNLSYIADILMAVQEPEKIL